jgi:hypothetical protein
MTNESLHADGDPRLILSDVRALARRVRLDQRVTWLALLVLAVVTLVGMPFDWYGMKVNCLPDGGCEFARRGVLIYWPPALLLAYTAIAVCYLRAARARGLGTRVLPYAITGAVTTAVFTAAWVAAALYFPSHPYRFPAWALVLDRLITPWGMIGIALLVLARLERNTALLVFTLGYLALVLAPIDPALHWDAHWGMRASFLPQQILSGTALLLGAAGFAMARRRQR